MFLVRLDSFVWLEWKHLPLKTCTSFCLCSNRTGFIIIIIIFIKEKLLFAKLVKPNLCLLLGLLVCLYNWNIQIWGFFFCFFFYQILWFALELVISSEPLWPNASYSPLERLLSLLDWISVNTTQIIAVQILKIEGIYTLERGEIVQEKKKGREGRRGGDREIERFLILERGGRLRNRGGRLLKSSN